MLWIPELIVAAIAVIVVSRLRRDKNQWESVARILAGRGAVAAAALITAGVTWCVWRTLNDVGTIHDEASYLLQAEIFARGQWTAPGAPIPAFF